MKVQYYEIKDSCRRRLIPYTMEAFSCLPRMETPLILDLGCGTGESTLAVLEACNGFAYALDSDKESLARLIEKAVSMNMEDRIRIINDSVLNAGSIGAKFDLVIAEGILNVVGFETGLDMILQCLKQGGYAIIHDELSGDREKRLIFEREHLRLLNAFELDESVWWDDYYAWLEALAESACDKELFRNELKEIGDYKVNPEKFRSIFYVLEKESNED
jgi:SAM-dependent methyltransferase